MIYPFISEELSKARTVSEYLPWVLEQIEGMAATPEQKDAYRFRNGLAKQLAEEALPLGYFAHHHFGDIQEVKVQLVLGNQPYDAIVLDERVDKAPFSRIEITQAHEGEDFLLRMLALKQDGSVCGIGPVTKVGTKRTGIQVMVSPQAKSGTALLHEEFERIEEAVKRKADKVYESDTALVVMFSDRVMTNKALDMKELQQLADRLSVHLKAFRWFALVGWSGNTFHEIDLAA